MLESWKDEVLEGLKSGNTYEVSGVWQFNGRRMQCSEDGIECCSESFCTEEEALEHLVSLAYDDVTEVKEI